MTNEKRMKCVPTQLRHNNGGGVGTAMGRVLDQLSFCTFFGKAHNNFMY